MKRTSYALAPLLLTLAFGCQKPVLDEAIVGAHQTTIAAIRAKDGALLWDLSPKALHDRFDALVADLDEVITRVKREYPTSEHEKTLASIGATALAAAVEKGHGRDLFLALIDFSKLADSEEIERGIEVASTTIDGDSATATTKAGEVMRFVREDDMWKTTLILDQMDSHPVLKALDEHVREIKKDLGEWLAQRQESTDPTRPEGAFNVFVEAVRRGRRVMVYEQLDEASRKQVEAALPAVKALQQALEKRFPTMPERQKYLTERKLGWVEGVADDKSLFAALWESGALTADLPSPTGTTLVHAVRRGKDGLMNVVVRAPTGEATYTFRLAKDGTWKLASLEAAIEREAVRRFASELAQPALQAPTPVAPTSPDAKGP